MLSIEQMRRRDALAYLAKYHPAVARRVHAGALNGPSPMGGWWSDIRDKAIGDTKAQATNAVQSATSGITAQIDKVKADLGLAVSSGDASAQSGILAKLSGLVGPATATAVYNLFRIQNGKPPVSLADATGVGQESSALRFIPYAVGAVGLLWGLSLFRRR